LAPAHRICAIASRDRLNELDVDTLVVAFDAIRKQRPDVLLADLWMAVKDGYSLIQRWRLKEQDEQRTPTATTL
jgi:CheY-like chemotaxis protein